MPSIATNQVSTEHVLSPLCKQWLHKISDAKKIKWDRFGQYAVEGMKFYDAAHDWMWKEEYARGKGGFLQKGDGAALPMFRMQVNRIFEAVALFGPALYHRNPDIEVTPVNIPLPRPSLFGLSQEDIEAFQQQQQQPQPQEQPQQQGQQQQPAQQQQNPQLMQTMQAIQQMQRQHQMDADIRYGKAELKAHYLNWLQVEGDKKTHARRSITEAIIKGMGVLWTDIYQPRGSQIKFPWSFHISIDDIVVDPDAEYWEDVQWIARYCCHPVNLVEQMYSLPAGSLKGHMQSAASQGDTYGDKGETAKRKRRGKSFDLIEYWMIYSKNGFGDKLRKSEDADRVVTKKSKYDFSAFGDFCKIVVARNVPFPLNMPTDAIKTEEAEELIQRAQWEVPYWEGGGWPATFLSFYDKPGSVWPVSIIKPCIGEMRFMNWCMSFLADKVAASCQTYVAVAKQAGMEIQNQLKNGMAPYTILEISQITGRSISDVVSFLDAPQFSLDIWKMLAEVADSIDKRTGLTDLVYGMTDTQIRSATEANVKEQNTNIRPDDMASRVEDFLSETALNEMAAAVWSCGGQDVIGALGEAGAMVWEQQIMTQDFASVIHDYDYRVAAGTARKPNKNSKQRALTDLGQVILPTIQQYALQGVVEPWNAYISDVADCMDLDPTPYLLNPPPPQQGPSPEEQMAQMEMQKAQVELQIKQAEFQMKQQLEQQKAQVDIQMKQAEVTSKQQLAQAEMIAKQQLAQLELQTDQAKSVQELKQAALAHSQEMQQQDQMNQQEMLIERARLSLVTRENEIKLEALKAMNEAKIKAARAQARAAAQSKPSSSSGK